MRKLLRTIQSEVPFLKGARDAVRNLIRGPWVRSGDAELAALRFVPHSLSGCYVDVGANQGQSIAAIQRWQPQARIHSFEPDPQLASVLRRRYQRSAAVTLHGYGLGDTAEPATLYTPIYNGFIYDGLASFDRQCAATWLGPDTLYRYRPQRLRLRETTCATARLDDEDLDPVFIKIDVQGRELQVVQGGLATIRRWEPVLMIEDVCHRPGLYPLLRQLGYEQYKFDDRGFYRAEDGRVPNFLFLTAARAKTVVRAERGRGTHT